MRQPDGRRGRGVTVVVKSNRRPQMPSLIRAAVAQEVSKATLQVEAKSKALVTVKTGTLRRSTASSRMAA